MPDYLQLTGTPAWVKTEIPPGGESIPKIPVPFIETIKAYLATSPYLTEEERKALDFEQQLDRVLEVSPKSKNELGDFVRSLLPGYQGSSEGTPVRLANLGSNVGAAYIPFQDTIFLNRKQLDPNFQDRYDVREALKHETGHAQTERVFGKTEPKSATPYRQLMDEFNTLREVYENTAKTYGENDPRTQQVRAMVTRKYDEYLRSPMEQAANWVGKLFGSWSNETQDNPGWINKLFDAIYK